MATEEMCVTDPTFDQGSWERRWEHALQAHGDRLSRRSPNEHLMAEVGDLPPGSAWDAGCGHGAEAIWLATRGWRVTAVDFSVTALEYGRLTALRCGDDVAQRVDWVYADLGAWTPSLGGFDLVSCLYLHVAGSVGDMVRRLGAGVAPGGTLLLVGHLPVDPATGRPSPAAAQRQVTIDAAREALDPGEWELLVSEVRPRSSVGTGVDAVVRAVRRR